MKAKLRMITITASLLFACTSNAQTDAPIFPKGDLSLTKNHTGSIWLNELNVGDSAFDPSVAVATYGPGAKLDWHIHPGGQVLLITEGTGYYQERGKPVRIVHKGDVVKAAAGVEALAWSNARKYVHLYRCDSNAEGQDYLVGARKR